MKEPPILSCAEYSQLRAQFEQAVERRPNLPLRHHQTFGLHLLALVQRRTGYKASLLGWEGRAMRVRVDSPTPVDYFVDFRGQRFAMSLEFEGPSFPLCLAKVNPP